jgi:uncharacterized membrane protein YjjP (DUF1212 family)
MFIQAKDWRALDRIESTLSGAVFAFLISSKWIAFYIAISLWILASIASWVAYRRAKNAGLTA